MSAGRHRIPVALARAYAALRKAGYARIEDLAMIAPNSYSDQTRITPIAEAAPGAEVLVEVAVASTEIVGHGQRRELRSRVRDASGTLFVRYLNFAPWQQAQLRPGNTVRLFGLMRGGDLFSAQRYMTHPLLKPAGPELPQIMMPSYPAIKKVPGRQVGQLATSAARALSQLADPLPEQFRRRHGLLALSETLRLLHRPRPEEDPETALESLKFREWLAHLLSQRAQHRTNTRRPGIPLPSTKDDLRKFASFLPFKLTAGQQDAMRQIAADIAQPHAMRRLLHGDVGCGKTLVAAYACWLCVRAGHTAAFMAPTEILADQHRRRLTAMFEKLGIEHEMLAGSTAASARRKIEARLAAQPGRCVIGTHALVQAKAALPQLGLAVIDEQHRFGVKQRHALADKNEGAHVLMMSATPIPRSMVLGIYANVDVTRIRDRPHDREIKTLLLRAGRSSEIIEALRKDNLQAYWICPLIRKSDKSGAQAAEDEYRRLCRVAPDLAPMLIHGRQTAAEKKKAMAAFESGETRLLIATTVVEVGVDDPDADVVVLANAERFGLSQLHQLRGRVGRGNKRGFCALLYGADTSEAALERLKAIHSCSDGFDIARQDLRLRGPGDIAGSRQSGLSRYRFADFAEDEKILERVPAAADELLGSYPEAAKEHWRMWLGRTTLQPIAIGPPTGARSAASLAG